MTASPSQYDESEVHLDSTAHIMNRISSQLASQLSLVQHDGRRRPGPPALVVVAHGSRDPRALSTVRTLLDRVREQRPGLSVHLGHIELNEPLLTDTLAGLDADGTADAVLVPLLLARGYRQTGHPGDGREGEGAHARGRAARPAPAPRGDPVRPPG